MIGFARLTLRQAQEALHNGRLEEAHRLLCQPEAVGHRASWELLKQIGQGFVERGERHLRHENPAGAWHDLIQAEQIGGTDSGAERLRQALTRLGLAEARALLEAGEANRAAQALAQLRERAVRQPEVQLLEEASKGWVLARDLADRGELSQALQTLDRVQRLLPGPRSLDRFHRELEDRQAHFTPLLVKLHEALDQRHWREVLQLAERVLALAPQHAEARKARTGAWKAIEPPTEASPASPPEPDLPAQIPSQRFLLWIDGVGGFLVCLGARVTLGQAAPDVAVDVPLFADVSRMHATLTRDSEGYLLEAVRPVQVNGQLTQKLLLQPEDRFTLGHCCQLQFLQPVPVSATARLDLVSGHRLPLSVDGIILMADTLVLGPGPQVHVAMPDLRQSIILFRHKDGLGVRYIGNLTVDGQPCRERGMLGPAARVSGDDFAFAVEPVGVRIGNS